MIEPFEKDYGDDWWYRTQLAFAQIELGQFGVGEHNIERALVGLSEERACRAHPRPPVLRGGRARGGPRPSSTDWMKDYPRDGLMHCHNSWHMAVWSLETGRSADAWRIYDDALRPGAAWGPQVNVATDCPAFLLRAEMAGHERKPELWRELAEYSTQWFGRPGLSFVDMHTVLAYAMAGDDEKLAPFTDNPRGAPATWSRRWRAASKPTPPATTRPPRPRSSPWSTPTSASAAAAPNATCWNMSSPPPSCAPASATQAQSPLTRRPHNAKVGGFPLAGL